MQLTGGLSLPVRIVYWQSRTFPSPRSCSDTGAMPPSTHRVVQLACRRVV